MRVQGRWCTLGVHGRSCERGGAGKWGRFVGITCSDSCGNRSGRFMTDGCGNKERKLLKSDGFHGRENRDVVKIAWHREY